MRLRAALRRGAFACNTVALAQLAGLFLVARLVAYPNKCIIVYSEITHTFSSTDVLCIL